jgi:hypothetical protein
MVPRQRAPLFQNQISKGGTKSWQKHTAGKVGHLVDVGVGEETLGDGVVLLVIDPGGEAASLSVCKTDIDGGKEAATMFPHACRETGGDALGGDDVVGGANGGVVLLLARLTRQHRKDAPVDVDKRVGVAGLMDEPRHLRGLKIT